MPLPFIERILRFGGSLRLDAWRLMLFRASLGFGFWSFFTLALHAQPAPPPQDPLMTLMLSQPRLDTNSPVTAIAVFDPPAVRPGEESVYHVTLNALEESVEWPREISAPAKLEMRARARGQILLPSGAAMQPRTTYNYRVRSRELGQFTVPEFKVKVYEQTVTVPAAQLEVVPAPPASPPAPYLVLEVARTNLFVGQPTRARILSPGSPGGGVQMLTQAQLVGDGFIVDQSTANQRIDQASRDGVTGPA